MTAPCNGQKKTARGPQKEGDGTSRGKWKNHEVLRSYTEVRRCVHASCGGGGHRLVLIPRPLALHPITKGREREEKNCFEPGRERKQPHWIEKREFRHYRRGGGYFFFVLCEKTKGRRRKLPIRLLGLPQRERREQLGRLLEGVLCLSETSHSFLFR